MLYYHVTCFALDCHVNTVVMYPHHFYYAFVFANLTHATSAYPTIFRLYEKLLKVSEKGHQKAMEKVAYAMLFGDYMNQNVTKAKEMFEKLAMEGSPKAQMVKI